MKYKAIILAGGLGTRLYPMTQLYSKHLISIYDKPMIYYPLSFLMMMGIKDILIIADIKTLHEYDHLFLDGNSLGINIEYAEQQEPKGIAEAFLIGEHFIGKDNVILMLGDNLFYGDMTDFKQAITEHTIATIFAYYVNNPQNYGVVEIDQNSRIKSLEEKPTQPKSNYAIPGLYIYNNLVVDIAKKIQPSDRDELEITDINKYFLKEGGLRVKQLGRGIAWLDTGTPDSLLEAGAFIASIEKRQGLKVGCVEEIARRQNFISQTQFENLIYQMPSSSLYRKYLFDIKDELYDI